ncbi:MAG: mannose-1-phosphate guanylyltransferase [Arcanobacterium sp.]|nr:mannose-1-phosphate guanylyltransferase [Arcanobacterium sp.]
MSIPDFHAIIPAGGAGTRLWPLSRVSRPKFLNDLLGEGRTMIQATVDRLRPLAGSQILIVTGEKHLRAISEQLPNLQEENFITEPSGRDSMAAIGLAAAVLHERHGECVVGSFAADHHIKDTAAFQRAVTAAIESARTGALVTVGITPDYPATGFGYIHAAGKTEFVAHRVQAFVEKPAVEVAEEYFASQEYFWNAGMFLGLTSTILQALEKYQPQLAADIRALAKTWDTDLRGETLAEIWPGIQKIAIDYAIAEPLAADGGVEVVPVEMGWSDVGDYASLAKLRAHLVAESISGQNSVKTGKLDDVFDSSEKDAVNSSEKPEAKLNVPELNVSDAQVTLLDSAGAFVVPGSKPIFVLGVPEAVVVETDDVIFVSTQEKAQRVKELVENLPVEYQDLK